MRTDQIPGLLAPQRRDCPNHWPVDTDRVRRRTLTLLALGLLAIAGAGAFAVSTGHSTPSLTPSANWGLYSSPAWDAVSTKLEQRGFLRESVHVATGTRLERNGQAFALLAARSSSGRDCFVVARGTALGPTICKLTKPLTVYTESDRCAPCSPHGSPANALTLLALVRRDVTSVTTVAGGRETGIGMVAVEGGALAFNLSGPDHGATTLRARGANNTILAIFRLPPR